MGAPGNTGKLQGLYCDRFGENQLLSNDSLVFLDIKYHIALVAIGDPL